MDTLSMPLVDGRFTTPDQALAALRRSGQGALVVKVSDQYSLAWASEIDEARRQGLPNLTTIPNREPAYLARMEDALTRGVDLIQPRRTWMAYESLLDTVGAQYVLIAVADNAAMVVTRHEGLRAMVDSVVLECDGPPHHVFPKPDKRVGDDCPRCPADSTGRRPKIRLSV